MAKGPGPPGCLGARHHRCAAFRRSQAAFPRRRRIFSSHRHRPHPPAVAGAPPSDTPCRRLPPCRTVKGVVEEGYDREFTNAA